MKIAYDIVQNGEDYDDILHRKLFDVNIRLAQNNIGYSSIIHNVITYMHGLLHTKYEDYEEVKGISGANVGIPFNIIVIKRKKDDLIMINPKIISHTKETVEAKSNCGSLNLPESILVPRYTSVVVSYYNEQWEQNKKTFDRKDYGFTIQHEIEHNLGILITDK